MRSSSGQHFLALDHIRAVAAWLVFVWHFNHGLPTEHPKGAPVPFEGAPWPFPASLMDEGHTGVALFMTLSGYLFAKLLQGRSVRFFAFLWNRALRLFPLLFLVLGITGIDLVRRGLATPGAYLEWIAKGFVLPTLPNGAWSITVELHFYVVLPILLFVSKRASWPLLVAILGTLSLRAWFWNVDGTVQSLAYATIVGRFDQFVFGILALRHRDAIARHWKWALLAMLAFAGVFHAFDVNGGFYGKTGYPSPDPTWIWLPTAEGLAYALGIAVYDARVQPSGRGLSGFLAKVGGWSYSIYLLHFFVVFHLGNLAMEWLGPEGLGFWSATALATACFLLMVPLSWLSFVAVEAPFLKLRRPYLK